MSDSLQHHRRQPTRLPHPWDFPGKSTGVECHCLLQCMKVKSESEVAQSCPTLCDPMDCMQPTRLLHPWDFPGKSTGVGCHCLLRQRKLLVSKSNICCKVKLDCLKGSAIVRVRIIKGSAGPFWYPWDFIERNYSPSCGGGYLISFCTFNVSSLSWNWGSPVKMELDLAISQLVLPWCQ